MYHIVKRLKWLPVSAKPDETTLDDLRRKVESSDRILTTKKVLSQKVMKSVGFQKVLATDNELWAFSDSILNNTRLGVQVNINPATAVLKISRLTEGFRIVRNPYMPNSNASTTELMMRIFFLFSERMICSDISLSILIYLPW